MILRNLAAMLVLLAGFVAALKALMGVAWPALTAQLFLGLLQLAAGLFLAGAAAVAALLGAVALIQPPKEGK